MNLNAIGKAITPRWARDWRAARGWGASPPTGWGLGAWPPAKTASWLAVAAAVLVFGVALLATELGRSPAAVAPAPAVELGRSESAGLPVGFDLVAKLLVVLALIYATATVARRYLLKVPSGPRGLLRVLDTSLIGPKKNVYVVEIGGRVLVIGATESAMSTLTQFDDAETVASLVASARPSGVGFQRYLEASLSRRTDPVAVTATQPLDLLAQAATRLRTDPTWGLRLQTPGNDR